MTQNYTNFCSAILIFLRGHTRVNGLERTSAGLGLDLSENIYYFYLFVSSIHTDNKKVKHTTIHQCGLNGQHRVMPLMCGRNMPTYKNNAIRLFKSTQ